MALSSKSNNGGGGEIHFWGLGHNLRVNDPTEGALTLRSRGFSKGENIKPNPEQVGKGKSSIDFRE